jgi:stage IV sporulation protein FB
MGWQDRSYYRDRSSGSGNPLMWLLMGSVSLGRWFGIEVRVHASLIVFAAFMILFPGPLGGIKNAATTIVALFSIVLMHEFGHCFASRSVGGNPNEILMYPLGGLAMADAPHRPWATFVTVAGGPLVNVLICLLAGIVLVVVGFPMSSVWASMGAPLHIHVNQDFFAVYEAARKAGVIADYLWFFFATSYLLLLFNLLPIFPLDGGQLLQSLIWVKKGYYKATYFASVVGLGGSVLLGLWGFRTFNWLVVFIAIMCFQACLAKYRELRANGPWAYEEEEIYSAAYENPDRPRKKNARKLRAAQREERMAQQEQQQVDAILAKVHEKGMHSLTWLEKRALKRATERQRKRAGG